MSFQFTRNRDREGRFAPGMVTPSVAVRFAAFISPEPMSGCWLWAGGLTTAGYGMLGRGDGTTSSDYAHRISWRLHRGAIPDRLCVLHKCDNRACVNPDHLFVGTKRDNIHDMIAKGRSASHMDPSLVRAVREARRQRVATGEILRAFNITPTIFYGIVNGRTRRYVQ